MEDLHQHRRSYEKDQLTEQYIRENPIEQFRDWFLDAEENPLVAEANAMSISTIEADQCPRTRMVLLKAYNEEGFIFYTNYDSRKGQAISMTGHACLHFFWPSLERQITIKSTLKQLAPNLSDGYFHARPRGSQLGALASPQSQEVPDRAYLENQLQALERKWEGLEIPRPDNWGGYLAKPYEIEFWQGRPNRLHDRIIYELENQLDWKIKRLAP